LKQKQKITISTDFDYLLACFNRKTCAWQNQSHWISDRHWFVTWV